MRTEKPDATHSGDQSRGALERLLTIAFLCSSFCLLYCSMWSGGLWWKDSWRAILTTSDKPLHPQLTAYLDGEYEDFWSYAFQHDVLESGRFRPLHWALTTVESALMRDHPRLWIAETHLIGILGCLLLFFAARRLGLGVIPALLPALWIMVAGRRLWAELQLSEEPGLVLTALALYAFLRAAEDRSRAWDVLGLASAACAGMFKETFALIIPSLLLFRVLLECRRAEAPPIFAALGRLRWVLALGGVVWLALVSVLFVLLLDPAGYDNRVVGGAAATSRWSPIRWMEMLWAWSDVFAHFIPLLGLVWLAPVMRSCPRVRRDMILGALILVLWLGPQLLTYTASGFREHYFIPAILPVAFTCAFGVEVLFRQRARWLPWGIVALVTAFLLKSGLESANVVSRIAAASDAQAKWMERTVLSNSQEGRVLLATDNLVHSRNMTFLTMLGEMGVHPPVSLFVGSIGNKTENRLVLEAALMCFPGSVPLDEPPADLDSIKLIACMTSEPRFRNLAEGWYSPEEWSCQEIDRSFTERHLSFLPPSLSSKVEHIRYAVLTRK